MAFARLFLASIAAAALAGCSGGADHGAGAPAQAAATTGRGAPAGLTLAAVNGARLGQGASSPAGSGQAAGEDTAPDNEINGYDDASEGNAVSNATTSGPRSSSGDGGAADPVLLKAEVLLDRADISPGVMDGRMGENVKNALSAYQRLHGLPVSGSLDQATWAALTAADAAPVLKVYTLTSQDVAGPWAADVGEDFVKLSQQPTAGYTSPKEMLAERFHMDQALLVALNPQADFAKAGTQLVVVDPGQGVLPTVKTIEVDKHREEVVAYDADHKAVGVFPATVGSTERPSPKGTWTVKGVAKNPDYTYDPSKLTWGPKSAGKLHIPPGPNNPVGSTWIALTAPDYGIHGTPDPHTIGKTASHGCVRLTNWDVQELSRAVKPGVKVTFLS